MREVTLRVSEPLWREVKSYARAHYGAANRQTITRFMLRCLRRAMLPEQMEERMHERGEP